MVALFVFCHIYDLKYKNTNDAFSFLIFGKTLSYFSNRKKDGKTVGDCEKCKKAKKQKSKKIGCKKRKFQTRNCTKKQKSKKLLSVLLETTQTNSHYCYLLLSEVHLQEVLDFVSGVPNYKNELLLNIVEAIKPTSHNG
jgi:hypothetical protein